MSRRAREYEDEYREESGPRRRFARQKGPNMGLMIALGSALVVGVVVILIISGSSSGEAEVAAARALMKDVFISCIHNDERIGIQLVDPRGILELHNRAELKTWHELTPERKDELYSQAWRWVRQTVVTELGIDSLQKAELQLGAAEGWYESVPDRVQLTWPVMGVNWNATASHASGRWLLTRLDRQ